jgi:glycosyltransferase involved in cell wall biosynthesis
MAELVENGVNGLLFEPGNVASLADKLKQIAQDVVVLRHLGRGCRPVKSVAQEMEELLGIYAAAMRSDMRLLGHGGLS